MKVAVFGATGATGSKVVEIALARGHDVLAIVREPEVLPPTLNLRVHYGDVLDRTSFSPALAGVDAVITCIGPARNFSPGTLVSRGTINIVASCEQLGIKRLILQSGITLSDGKELAWFDRFAVRLLRRVYWKACDDKVVAETCVRNSNLNWVIVRPVGLQASPARVEYTAGPLARVRPLQPLPFSNAADCNVRALTETTWTRQVVNVGR
jgi:putative NADH-flavin reductase